MTTNNIKKMAAKVVLSGGLALAGFALASGTARAWNPQPDPPRNPSSTYVYPQPNPAQNYIGAGITGLKPNPVGPGPGGGS